MSLRTERVGEQLRDEVARILREEITDPRIGLLTLTRVDVSPDFSNAMVYWSALDVGGGVDLDQMSEGLASAAGYIRRQLARTLTLRRTPALRFRHDPSIETGSRTLSLIREVRRNPSEATENEDGG